MIKHTVIEFHENDALLFTSLDSPSPYIVAHNYNKETKSWSHGSYHNDLLESIRDLHGDKKPEEECEFINEDYEYVMVVPVVIKWRDTGEKQRVRICETNAELPQEADNRIFYYGMNREDLLLAKESESFPEDWVPVWVGHRHPMFY